METIKKEKFMQEFVDSFLERFKDDDIDFKLLYVSKKATTQILDYTLTYGTDEQKESMIELFEKIIEIGEMNNGNN